MLPATLLAGVLLLQQAQATVTGAVLDDASGAPLAGAVVVLTDLERGVVTDDAGRYLIADVPAGPQHVEVRALGYAARVVHALVPRTGTLRLDVSLERRPIELDPLEVVARVAMRGVEDAGDAHPPDVSVSAAAMRNHPLLAETDPFQAVGGGAIVMDPETPSGLHVRGAGSDQTAYALDGVPVLNPYHTAGVFSAWNADALAEVEVHGAAPPPELPAALGGVVAARVREPLPSLVAQGSLSTTQARLALSGAAGEARWLASARGGYPDAISPNDELSYLQGGTSDALAHVSLPVAAGELRLLGTGADNHVDAAATLDAEEPRNAFDWNSHSLGAGWRSTHVDVLAWRARTGVSAAWASSAHGATDLDASRSDAGARLLLRREGTHSSGMVGLRFESMEARYRVRTDSAGDSPLDLDARAPLWTALASYARDLGGAWSADAAIAAFHYDGELRAAPRMRVSWQPGERWSASVAAARLHQFAHSLRNPESVIGRIFPADLWMLADVGGVPVGRADQLVLTTTWRPAPGMRVQVQGWTRASRGLPLVAPVAGDPFVIDSFVAGSGSADGVALDFAASSARYGALASWSWQRVRLDYNGAGYDPGHGSAHIVDAGVVVFPTATTTVRVGVNTAFGRRGTLVVGGLEWEACNLLDQGCELAGSPTHDGQEPGGTELPAYVRVDLGARKHWHLSVRGHDTSIALFATVTNVFGFGNVMTWVVDPETGERVAVEMRPLSPLVVGLDWRL